MSGLGQAMLKKGYMPLVDDGLGAIGWQGKYISNFWMWTGKFTEYEGGVKQIRTVQVTELKEVALHYWQDGWIPVEPVTDELLRAMEVSLREHRGLQAKGIRVPDDKFLEVKTIPAEFLNINVEGLKQKGKVSQEIIESLKRERGGY